MKRLLIPILVLLLAGAAFYGVDRWQKEQSSDGEPQEASLASGEYRNDQYGFAFTYPPNMEVRVREEANRQIDYVGIPVDFFISLRDIVRDEKPVSIAYFYAAPALTVDAFKTALEASDPAVKVSASEEVEYNGVRMTKIMSSTALGTDKFHYLFDRNGTMIVVSVFLAEENEVGPVMQTIR